MGTGTARPRPRAEGRERSLGRGDSSSIRMRGEAQYESDETTSPPLRVASAHMTPVPVDAALDEPDAAVAEEEVGPAGVVALRPAVRRVVGAAVGTIRIQVVQNPNGYWVSLGTWMKFIIE